MDDKERELVERQVQRELTLRQQLKDVERERQAIEEQLFSAQEASDEAKRELEVLKRRFEALERWRRHPLLYCIFRSTKFIVRSTQALRRWLDG